MAVTIQRMSRFDLHGRVIGGLFEACGATNPLYKARRLDVQFAASPYTPQQQLSDAKWVGAKGEEGEGVKTGVANATGPQQLGAVSGQNAQVIPLKPLPGTTAQGDEDGGAAGRRKAATTNAAVANKKRPGVATNAVTPNPATSQPPTPRQGVAASTPTAAVTGATNNTGNTTKKAKQAQELYCVCKAPYDDSTAIMIECDGVCEDWFHPKCLGYQTSGKKEINVVVDADGSKVDLGNNNKFYCAWCELSQGGSFERKNPSLSARLARWCDVMDLGDESIDDPANDLAAVTRWRLLMQAKRDQQQQQGFAACQNCKKAHHPLLPCPIKRTSASPKAADVIISEDSISLPMKMAPLSSETFGLVVGGKYQTLSGTIIGTAKKWNQLQLDNDSGGSVILVPSNCLLTTKIGKFTPATGDQAMFKDDELIGVAPSNGAYVAFLDFDDSTRIILGRYASKIRAARVHDLAARLQFPDDVADPLLNFPDTFRQAMVVNKASSTSSNGSPSPAQMWETALQLAHQVALGPFASLSSSASQQQHMDPIQVMEWCDSMLLELENVPGYFPTAERAVELIYSAISQNCSTIAGKMEERLSNASFAAFASQPLPAATNGDSEGEDELSVFVKKFIRTRNAKQKRS